MYHYFYYLLVVGCGPLPPPAAKGRKTSCLVLAAEGATDRLTGMEAGRRRRKENREEEEEGKEKEEEGSTTFRHAGFSSIGFME